MVPGQTNELLPCPLCGGDALIQEHEAHSHAGGLAAFMPDYPGSFTLECMGKDCNTGLIADTRAEVVAMWNRRAPAPTSEPGARDAVVAVARKILQEALDGVVVHPCDEFDESVRAKGLYGHMAELYAALDTPASPAEHVAEVGSTYQLVWAGSGPIAPIVEKHGLKVGSKLYARPAADPAPLVAQASPWISIDDRLPPVETDVLVFGKRGDSKCFSVAGIFNGELHAQPGSVRQSEWLAPDSETELRFIVSHWQPLQPAPEASPLVEDAQRIVAGKVEL